MRSFHTLLASKGRHMSCNTDYCCCSMVPMWMALSQIHKDLHSVLCALQNAFEQERDIVLGCGYYLQRSQVVWCGKDEDEAVKGSAFFNPFEALDIQAEGHQSAWHAANCLPRGKDTTLQYQRSNDSLRAQPECLSITSYTFQQSALSLTSPSHLT